MQDDHFIHTLARVPVQEGLAAEHARELLRNALEPFFEPDFLFWTSSRNPPKREPLTSLEMR